MESPAARWIARSRCPRMVRAVSAKDASPDLRINRASTSAKAPSPTLTCDRDMQLLEAFPLSSLAVLVKL